VKSLMFCIKRGAYCGRGSKSLIKRTPLNPAYRTSERTLGPRLARDRVALRSLIEHKTDAWVRRNEDLSGRLRVSFFAIVRRAPDNSATS